MTTSDWTAAALDAVARGGLAAVAVEPLAAALKATKGSFYWHFANRDALIEAALARWEQRDTDGVIATMNPTEDADSRLRGLLRLVFSSVRAGAGTDAGSVELALQSSADHPLVAPVLARVTERRLTVLTDLFVELGLSRREARDRGLLAYTAYLGHTQVARATPGVLPAGRAFTAHVDQVVEALVP